MNIIPMTIMFVDSLVEGLAVDHSGGWLFYTEGASDRPAINKVSLDGGSPWEVVDLSSAIGTVTPIDLVLDLKAK